MINLSKQIPRIFDEMETKANFNEVKLLRLYLDDEISKIEEKFKVLNLVNEFDKIDLAEKLELFKHQYKEVNEKTEELKTEVRALLVMLVFLTLLATVLLFLRH